MATITHQFDIQAGKFRTTAFPALVQANGSNYPVPGLAYDAAADEAAFFQLVTTDYGSGNPVLRIFWYADTATTNDVVWGAQIAALTPGDSQDIEADGLATAQTVTDAAPGTAGFMVRADLTITNLDSLAVDDWVTLRLYRDADNAADDMAGDAIVVGLTFEYSDT